MTFTSRPSSLGVPAEPASPVTLPTGVAAVLGRWLRTRTQPARQLRLVETLSVGPKRSVALLELGGERFLAGMGSDGVTTLLQVQGRAQAGADQP